MDSSIALGDSGVWIIPDSRGKDLCWNRFHDFRLRDDRIKRKHLELTSCDRHIRGDCHIRSMVAKPLMLSSIFRGPSGEVMALANTATLEASDCSSYVIADYK